MKEAGFIPKDAWKTYLESLSKRFTLYAPCKDGETVTFRAFEPGKEVCLDRPANAAPKGVIFPQSETLFTFNFTKDADDPRKTDVEIDESTPAAESSHPLRPSLRCKGLFHP